MSEEQIFRHFQEVIGATSDNPVLDWREGRVRVGLAAKAILHHGKTVNLGLMTELKSFFHFLPLNDENILRYMEDANETLYDVNGGCMWAEENGLNGQITYVSHNDRRLPESDEAVMKHLKHRLWGSPPELLDVAGMLIELVARGTLPRGPSTVQMNKVITDYFPGGFDEQTAQWGEIPSEALKMMTIKAEVNTMEPFGNGSVT